MRHFSFLTNMTDSFIILSIIACYILYLFKKHKMIYTLKLFFEIEMKYWGADLPHQNKQQCIVYVICLWKDGGGACVNIENVMQTFVPPQPITDFPTYECLDWWVSCFFVCCSVWRMVLWPTNYRFFQHADFYFCHF